MGALGVQTRSVCWGSEAGGGAGRLELQRPDLRGVGWEGWGKGQEDVRLYLLDSGICRSC